MAIAAFKIRVFATAKDLADYVVSAGGGVTTVISIVSDSSGKYILFYV